MVPMVAAGIISVEGVLEYQRQLLRKFLHLLRDIKGISRTLFSVTGNHFRFCYRSRWLPARALFYNLSLGLASILIEEMKFGIMLLTQGSIL